MESLALSEASSGVVVSRIIQFMRVEETSRRKLIEKNLFRSSARDCPRHHATHYHTVYNIYISYRLEICEIYHIIINVTTEFRDETFFYDLTCNYCINTNDVDTEDYSISFLRIKIKLEL